LNNPLSDEYFIQLTIELAKKGIGTVSPNPLVGAVIVKEGNVIATGYHAKFGDKHAEINAFENCVESPEGATLYVNLEPCSHYGKTPPCTDAIIQNKVAKVVIGTFDPNPLVGGKGIKILRDSGIEVVVGVLEDNCKELNKFFFKYIVKKLPYVTLKIAQTIDAKIADSGFNSKWITSPDSRTYVHRLRGSYDAVMVGSNTIKVDNPELSVRMSEGRNPYRVILNKNLDLDLSYKVFNFNDNKTIIICSEKLKSNKEKINAFLNIGTKVVFVNELFDGTLDLNTVLESLYDLEISSILAEGGNGLFTSFLKTGLYDELNVFIGAKILGSGLPSVSGLGINDLNNAVNLNLKDVIKFNNDVLLTYVKG